MRTLSKLAIVVAVGAAAAAAVRRYDLVNKGTALAEQGVEKVAVGAEWLTAKAVDFGTKFLDQFADADPASDPTEDEDELLADYVRRERAGANGDAR